MANGSDVVAAGAVVLRRGPGRVRQVLLVHRPKYDDWSFPKGKQERDEHVAATAVREVLEETGVEVRLGRPLVPQMYTVSGGRTKTVHYWIGRVIGDDDLTSFQPNAEVDQIGWWDLDKAADRLSYTDDAALLDQARKIPQRTDPLVIIRHAKALKRGAWDRPDPVRPLNDEGLDQALAVGPLLHAYGVTRVITSPSTRCLDTVTPYALEQVLPVEQVAGLSEEGYDAAGLDRMATDLLAGRAATVVCTHRPVLPELLGRLGVTEEPLSPAELLVLHRRKGRLVSVERHLVR
jgi:8-oxo-dGTP diphosphatase